MKAMIFAAGIGSRLRPITDTVPKPLVEVGGSTALERVMRSLRSAGVTEVVVNVHHHADKVVRWLADNDRFGLHVDVSREDALLLDTGGGLARAARWLVDDGPVIVHNADIVTDVDLGAMYEAHMRSEADVTLLVAGRKSSRRLVFGRSADGLARMHGWINASDGATRPEGFTPAPGMEQLAFGGVHVVSQSALRDIAAYRSDGTPWPIMDFYISQCRRLMIAGYSQPTPYRWHDIGTIDKLRAAREDFGV